MRGVGAEGGERPWARTGQELLAVGGEGEAADGRGVPLEGLLARALADVPDFDRGVLAGRGDLARALRRGARRSQSVRFRDQDGLETTSDRSLSLKGRAQEAADMTVAHQAAQRPDPAVVGADGLDEGTWRFRSAASRERRSPQRERSVAGVCALDCCGAPLRTGRGVVDAHAPVVRPGDDLGLRSLGRAGHHGDGAHVVAVPLEHSVARAGLDVPAQAGRAKAGQRVQSEETTVLGMAAGKAGADGDQRDTRCGAPDAGGGVAGGGDEAAVRQDGEGADRAVVAVEDHLRAEQGRTGTAM